MLVQDLGIFGGLGTDPNSMIPFALLVLAGYLALLRRRRRAAAAPACRRGASGGGACHGGSRPAAASAARLPRRRWPGDRAGAGAWRDRLRPGQLARALGAASPRTVAAAGALGVAIIGVVPMTAASASTTASPIIAEALDGSSAPLNFRAPAFQLTNQDGRQVSLASLRGKVVLLTFLDPVCTSDCPLIAQEFRQADQLLAGQQRRVELVAVVANPVYNALGYTQAFDRQEHLTRCPTGTT